MRDSKGYIILDIYTYVQYIVIKLNQYRKENQVREYTETHKMPNRNVSQLSVRYIISRPLYNIHGMHVCMQPS